MAKNLIFYFSGTGNSLKAAKDIAAVLGDTELVFMKGDCKIAGQYDRIGFVFPCYAGGIPEAVLRYIRKLNLTADSAAYYFCVVTANQHGGNCGAILQSELKKKGARLDYYRYTATVGNYVAMYNMEQYLDEHSVEKTLANQDTRVTRFAQEIKANAQTKTGMKAPYFTAFNWCGNQYFKAKEKQMHATDACISCGLCARLCPVENIAMQGGKPVFLHKDCAQCMACVQYCPKAAIEVGKATVGRTRYHHPEISAGELAHEQVGA